MPEKLLTPLEFWTYSTMLIDNQWGGHGTGFILAIPSKDDNIQGRVFLVTNKHVINPDYELRKSADKIRLHFNIMDKEGGSIVGQNLTLEFSYSETCREHPANDVDVLALDVTELFIRYPQIVVPKFNYNMFADQGILKDLDIKMGDEIIVIGFPQSYPLGLKHLTSNLPLVRAGIISSHIGENLVDNHEESNGTYRKRILRGFLIDGAIIPGSSGSPVILKPIATRNIGDQIKMQVNRNLLLGIVSETRYAYTTDFQSFAGLGLALDAETIRETIDLFFT